MPRKKKETQPQPSSHADITIVLDKSGSMETMKQSVVDGINEHIGEMRKRPGENFWSMVEFDYPAGHNQSCPEVLFERRPEKSVPFLALAPSAFGNTTPPPPTSSGEHVYYTPRGNTALVDALCETIDRTRARLSGQDNVKKLMMIVTDGQENASRKFSSEDLRQRIKSATEAGFEFVYLGANQDSFAEAGKYGITRNASYTYPGQQVFGDTAFANNFVPTAAGMRQAIASGFVGIQHMASGACYVSMTATVNARGAYDSHHPV